MFEQGKALVRADVDSGKLDLPESPVDLVIDELVRVARESSITLADVLLRVEQRFGEGGW